jgi:hypothetical protein
MKMAPAGILVALTELPEEEHKAVLELNEKLHALLKEVHPGVGLIALTLVSVELALDLEEKKTTDH